MDPVHGGVHVLYFPVKKHTKYVNHYDCYHPIGATQKLAHFNLLMVTLFV